MLASLSPVNYVGPADVHVAGCHHPNYPKSGKANGDTAERRRAPVRAWARQPWPLDRWLRCSR
jgi:hypothetical protein